jgi:hypothetical protein
MDNKQATLGEHWQAAKVALAEAEADYSLAMKRQKTALRFGNAAYRETAAAGLRKSLGGLVQARKEEAEARYLAGGPMMNRPLGRAR